jgi:CO/xanthine dehydrogenase Mo-binding subunit
MLVGRTLRDTPLLAQEKVRFVGEKVAAVVADDGDTAEEALTRIEVAYEELPAIFDPVQAMQPEAPVVHDGSPIYEGPAGPVQPRGNISHHHTWSGGDVEHGFRESDLLFDTVAGILEFDMDMASDHFYTTGSNRFSRGANDVWTG